MKFYFAKHDLDIQVIGSVCTDGAPAMLGNKSFFFWIVKTGYSTLAGYSLFCSSTCFIITNIAFKIEKCPWYFYEDHQLD